MSQSTIDLAARAAQLRKPGDGLSAVAALRDQLQMLEAVHVDNALGAGWSWTRIARALGVSRQAAHKKHSRRIRAAQAVPPAPPAPGRMLVTAQARRAVRFAREQARALGEEEVTTRHLLLGLLREGHGPAARALESSGIAFGALRAEVEKRRTEELEAASLPERLPIAQEARRVLEQSLREAVRLRDGHLGPEHMLLALVREDPVTADVLDALGVAPAAVESRLARILDEPAVIFQSSEAG